MGIWQSVPDPKKRQRMPNGLPWADKVGAGMPGAPPMSTSVGNDLSPLDDATKKEPPTLPAPPILKPAVSEEPDADESGAPSDGDADNVGGGAADDDIDQLTQNFIGNALDPAAADTSDEEAFVNQQILDQLGGDLVNQRARMGRAGFGASGALAGIENDARRGANADAMRSIYDIREREQNQAFQQGSGAIGLDIAKQEAAARLAQEQAQAEAIQALLGGTPETGDVPEGSEVTGDDGQTWTKLPNGMWQDASGAQSTTDPRNNDRETSPDQEAASYPGGADAWRAAQQDGATAAVRYSVSNHGDFSKLPQREPGPNAVTATVTQASGNPPNTTIYYDPATGELFRG